MNSWTSNSNSFFRDLRQNSLVIRECVYALPSELEWWQSSGQTSSHINVGRLPNLRISQHYHIRRAHDQNHHWNFWNHHGRGVHPPMERPWNQFFCIGRRFTTTGGITDSNVKVNNNKKITTFEFLLHNFFLLWHDFISQIFIMSFLKFKIRY